MSQPTIEATVCEVNSDIFHRVRLHVVPRLGELIELFPLQDQGPVAVVYEVVKVTHELHGLTDKVPHSEDGHHAVKVFVKPWDSESFQPGAMWPSIKRN